MSQKFLMRSEDRQRCRINQNEVWEKPEDLSCLEGSVIKW